ncbi:hypothetical protein [Bradyrhizobium sp. STM 3561]|uniref:hypothetical protein n=1 Tax=Bradyrhizobium sp. STM 3561 TaxID=578923 RepID=UPI00388F72AB
MRFIAKACGLVVHLVSAIKFNPLALIVTFGLIQSPNWSSGLVFLLAFVAISSSWISISFRKSAANTYQFIHDFTTDRKAADLVEQDIRNFVPDIEFFQSHKFKRDPHLQAVASAYWRPLARCFVYMGNERLGACKAYPTFVGPAFVVLDGRFDRSNPFDLFSLNHELAHLYDISFRQQVMYLYSRAPLIVNAVGLALLLVSTVQWVVAILVIGYLFVISRPTLLLAEREGFADTIGIVRLDSREAQLEVLSSLIARYTDYCELTNFPRFEWSYRLRNARWLLAELEREKSPLRRPIWTAPGFVLIDAAIVIAAWYGGSLTSSASLWFFAAMFLVAVWSILKCRKWAWRARLATEEAAMLTAGDSLMTMPMKALYRKTSPENAEESIRVFNKQLAERIAEDSARSPNKPSGQ